MAKSERFDELMMKARQRKQGQAVARDVNEAYLIADFRHALENNVEAIVSERLGINIKVLTQGSEPVAVAQFDLAGKYGTNRYTIHRLSSDAEPLWAVFRSDHMTDVQVNSNDLQDTLLNIYDEVTSNL